MEKEEKENREKNEQQTQSPSRQKAGKLVNERMKDKSPERGTSRKKRKKETTQENNRKNLANDPEKCHTLPTNSFNGSIAM